MAGEIADNSAAALRQQSFRWALDDCKKESSCQSHIPPRWCRAQLRGVCE